MLHKKLSHIPGFPDELKILIEHLIISHHGQYEFGSPKLPMFPEALMLHYLDDLDSKMESMRAQFERESEVETAWTSYNPSLGRPLLNSAKFLEKREPASHVAAPAVEDTSGIPEGPVTPPAPTSETVDAPATVDGEQESVSPLDALQRKFASHKVTTAGVKVE
jgi:3'-5' exoribonuclease